MDVNPFIQELNQNLEIISNTKEEYEEPPFVGKNDSYYIELEIPKSKNISYQQISEIIWKNYESTVLDSEGNPKKDLYNLNYSEPVKVTTEAQLYSLVPGDLLLIPNFSKDKNIKVNISYEYDDNIEKDKVISQSI